MDPQIQSQPTQSKTPSHSFQEPIKKHSGSLALFGKIIVFFVIAVSLLLGGYYLGIQTNPATVSPTPIQTIAAKPTATPTPPPPTPTPASQNTKIIKAGLLASYAFKPYSINVPADWTDARETTITANIDTLTLNKNGYTVTIHQTAFESGDCLYKNDKPNANAQTFTDSADINGRSGQFRRSWNQSIGQSITYTICQKKEDGSYSSMTTFGTINIVSPNPGIASTLTEVDGMIASLISQ